MCIFDLCKELTDIRDLLAVRRLAGADCTRLDVNLVAAFTSKVLAMKQFMTADALRLSRVTGSSQLPEEAKSQLRSVVDDSVAGKSAVVLKGCTTHTPSQKSCGAQLLTTSNRYLTALDWAWITAHVL